MSAPRDITQLLRAWDDGDRQAVNELMPLVYDELRRLARHYLQRERPDHTLQPTALVHEAYVRLLGKRDASIQDRSHFFGICAQLMRRILVDHARGHKAAKRGAGATLSLDEAVDTPRPLDVDLVALDDALTDLARVDPEQTRLIELRFFAGLTIDETAEALGVSPATVKRDWTIAKAMLRRRLHRDGGRARKEGRSQ